MEVLGGVNPIFCGLVEGFGLFRPQIRILHANMQTSTFMEIRLNQCSPYFEQILDPPTFPEGMLYLSTYVCLLQSLSLS